MRLPILILSLFSSCQVIKTSTCILMGKKADISWDGVELEWNANSAVCPQFGSYQNSSLDYSDQDGLFLSIHSPSQCYGRVTQWNFCYERSSFSSFRHGVKFMVYRQDATTSVYYRVLNSVTTFLERFLSQYDCLSLHLNQNEQFDIQPNDVLAACMIDFGFIQPLRVSSSSREEALRITTSNYDHCTEEQLLSLDMQILTSETRDFLLVETLINSSVGFRAGDNPKRTSSSNVSGIFINQAFPADSNGYVTAWNYCYYTSSVDISSTYTALFALWRYDNLTIPATLSMVNNSVTIITLQPEYTIASIYCKAVELESANYIPIIEGDYVGVALPSSNQIPLIGDTSAYDILVHSNTQEMITLAFNNFDERRLALHLYVDIDTSMQGNGGTTQQLPQTPIPTFIPTSTTKPPTTETSMTQVRGTSGGVVAAIVIIILVIVVAGGTGALIVALIVQRKFKTSRKTVSGIQNQTVPQSFGNINYTGYRDDVHDLQPYQVLPGTVEEKGITTQSDQYEPVIDPPVRPRAVSMLEASNVYASIDLHGEDLYSTIMEQSISQNIYAELESEPYQVPHTEEEHLYSQIYTESRAENIDRKTIKVVRHLGSGQFGKVDEGIWLNGSQEVKMAMKRLRDDASSSDKVKFLQEAVIMAQFNHENVIKLLGMVLEDNPIILVVELASHGDLRENLLDIRKECTDPGLPKLLLYFSRQVACGMHYLSSKHFVHRDLAARNILLSENCICKIADFGLSRDLDDDNYYKSSGGLVPVKWTAPEAIKYRKYSTASDVWSYGCVLYEIWSLGHKPFEKHQNFEVIDILNKGTRLPPPSGCPRALYATMIRCWHPDASKRPSFRDLVLTLTKPDDIIEIPGSVVTANPDFQTPGDLNVGIDVYKDLQMTYT